MKRKLLAFALCLAMILGCLPVTITRASAAEPNVKISVGASDTGATVISETICNTVQEVNDAIVGIRKKYPDKKCLIIINNSCVVDAKIVLPEGGNYLIEGKGYLISTTRAIRSIFLKTTERLKQMSAFLKTKTAFAALKTTGRSSLRVGYCSNNM